MRDGASPFGCLDLAGNAFEWCADLFGSYGVDGVARALVDPPPLLGELGPVDHVRRGGSHATGDAAGLRCARRSHARSGSNEDGLRVALGER